MRKTDEKEPEAPRKIVTQVVTEKSSKSRNVLVIISAVIVAFIVGILIFNFIIMPFIVRQGQESVVPDVVGKPINDAKKIILQSGFHLGEIVEVFDTLYPVGYVSGQKPKGGGTAKIGRIVSLNVSRGQKMVRVPFVAKLTLEQATNILENLGLRVGTVESIPSNLIQPGHVIATIPEPGSERDQGDYIKIQLSSGPPQPTNLMPNLVGLTLNVAQETLKTRNLILGEVKEIESDENPGTIIVQYPEEGMKLGLVDTVRLIAAKPRVQAPPPQPPKKGKGR
jgi:eukaryotic-like serine/threonine-protein kinase